MILTAFGSPEIKAECLRQGAVAFLEKPLNTEQLLAEIQRVLFPPETGHHSSGGQPQNKNSGEKF
jgi:FixJ family two-component response regulator